MEQLIKELGKHVGIYAENITTKKRYLLNHQDIFPAASVIKLPVLYILFLNYISGNLAPESLLEFNEKDFVEDSPWFESLNMKSGECSLKEIAHSMITVSDNTSTNLLIELFGLKEINLVIKNLGLKNTQLKRKMCDFKARNNGLENLTTPEDMALFFNKLIKNYGKQIKPENIQNFVFNDYDLKTSSLETAPQKEITMLAGR